jgi:putative ABC transport system permease protein
MKCHLKPAKWVSPKQRRVNRHHRVPLAKSVGARRPNEHRNNELLVVVLRDLTKVRTVSLMRTLLQNLRDSFRSLRESLGLTCTILLTIALGIGANTAIFTVAYATLLAPLPYPNPDRLVNVWSSVQGHRDGVSIGDFIDWRRRSTSFDDLNIGSEDNFNVATPESPEFLDGVRATPGYYGMLGNPLFLGRKFRPEEGEPGREHVVILTHRLWQHLGANPRVVGQAMQINGERYTVVGVFATGTADRWNWELMVPLVFKPEQINNHDSRYWLVTGRLKPGVTLQQAQAEMDTITAKEAKDYPKSNRGWGAIVEPYKNDFLPNSRKLTLWLLLGAVGFLLLIACLNVANLLLAKGITRQKEVAIRGALGARPLVIFEQFLTEGLVLAFLAGVVGVIVGYAMLRGLVAAIPPDALPAEADLRLNVPILLGMLAAATLAGIVFGCAPAWCASRVDPAGVLKEGGRAGIGVGRHRLRRVLIVGEFALSLTLLAGAGLSIHSFWNLTHTDLGVRTDHILGFYLDSVPLEKNPNQANTNAYYRRLLSSIEAVPGVSSACAMSYLPLDSMHAETQFTIVGQPAYANLSLRPHADFEMVTPNYFQTFGIRIVKGRGFTDNDKASSLKVAMVNEVFANRFLKGIDPLHQRVLMEQVIPGAQPQKAPLVEWQIVGVFHTVKSRGSREDNPEIDAPFWQEAYDISGVAVRTAQDPATMLKTIAAAINAVDPQAALYRPLTMEQVHDAVLANDRFALVLFASFAVVALLLAAVGIYGVMAFSVTQRSREIALRMALGATRSAVITLVMKEGVVLAATGSGVGLMGAYFVGRAMQSLLFGVSGIDLSAFGAVGLLLLVAALVACYLPALRAASVETMHFLRSD